MPRASINGVRLYYEERGSGTPILGIHGAGSSAVFWTDAAARLSELGRAIVYDRRGSHRSERPERYETTSVREHADDALELLRELDADPAILVGRSYGGTVALELAINHPESVRALALLEAGPMGLSAEYDEWFEGLAGALERTVAERGVDAVGEVVLREVFGAWEELPEVWRDIFTANSPALLAEIRGHEKLSDNSLLAELRVPTLIVAAEDSPVPLQRATDGLVLALPQARFARVAGGHAIDPAGPDVLAFIRELVGTQPARVRPSTCPMNDERELLRRTAEIAADFLETLDERPIWPPADVDELRETLGGPLPGEPVDPRVVVEELAAGADRGVVAIPSGRYFGFVIGGSLPAALAADWLTSTWDQNAGLVVCGPAAAVIEEVAGEWLIELFGLPPATSFAFVTGCQMAHVTCLAAARHAVLERAGWDVERSGLSGAPRVRVFVGGRRHVTVDRALRLLGLGSESTVAVTVDEQGRMRPHALETALADGDGPAIVCAQVGEVNTGAVDAMPEIVAIARAAGAWLHVDGAFGLWAAASPELRQLVEGVGEADSWATDAHKWLNVPYDCGLAFVAHPEAHRAAMAMTAEYLVADPNAARDQMDWTPEFSRRARGSTVYAALRSLGRSGVTELVERCCRHARRFADELGRLEGCEILNEVVLNQVLLRFESDEATRAILDAVQRSGEAWMSGTTWEGQFAIRISVSNWRTNDDDVTRTIAAFERALAAG